MKFYPRFCNRLPLRYSSSRNLHTGNGAFIRSNFFLANLARHSFVLLFLKVILEEIPKRKWRRREKGRKPFSSLPASLDLCADISKNFNQKGGEAFFLGNWHGWRLSSLNNRPARLSLSDPGKANKEVQIHPDPLSSHQFSSTNVPDGRKLTEPLALFIKHKMVRKYVLGVNY